MFNGVRVSARTIIELEKSEEECLRKHLTKGGGYTTVMLNTGISYPTLKKLERGGKGQVGVIIKIRDFLKKFESAEVA